MKKRLLAIIFAVGLTFALASCSGNAENSSPGSTVCSHTYENDCDSTCNVCGQERIPSEHTYDAVCDTDCNVCGGTRMAENHTYDNDCDESCNVCGAKRTPSAHVYYDEYDATCNECGGERVVPEDPVNGGNWTGEAPLK